jgi:hypothetical protein
MRQFYQPGIGGVAKWDEFTFPMYFMSGYSRLSASLIGPAREETKCY